MSTEHQDRPQSPELGGFSHGPTQNIGDTLFPIPRAMSTQHPDNARSAPFSENGVLKGEGEIAEAHYVYSTLGCDEQMWDYEGKAADVDVVLKLLLHDPAFFNANKLGQEIFLTLRIPNPAVERELRKKVEEALHNIVTSYDVASGFYNAPTAPIFQVILPFTTSAEEIVWVDSYYQEVVVGKQRHRLPGGQRVSEWMGEYRPESIQVIPLVEDKQRLSQVDTLIERYLQLIGRPVRNLRVFLARSDPAMNYGMVSAALLAKIALQRLHHLEQRTGVAIYPIIGVGGVPFRGNFRPNRVEQFLASYPSVQTFTVQSSFKYDYDEDLVQQGVRKLHEHVRGAPLELEESRALDIVERVTRRYQEQVAQIADLINAVADYIPQRRDRRLHVGLFGYARSTGNGEQSVHLPRAITFCAALYSLGIPPELLGLDALNDDDLEFLRSSLPHLTLDLADALRYVNEENVAAVLGTAGSALVERFVQETDQEHLGLTRLIHQRVRQGFDPMRTRQLVEWAAQTRGFLG